MTVEVRGFGWRHAGRRAWAVRGIDLRIEPGERVLLLGPSGAGKSTLLAALAGLLPEDSGEAEGTVMVGGRPPGAAEGRVGIVFQDPQAQLVMARCGDEVAFGLENLGWDPPAIWPRVDQVLATVGFPYGRDRPTSALSGGEQQRLVLAGGLAPRPGLLLLDEPTANLDPAGAALVRQALAAMAADPACPASVVLVEHRVADVLDLVNRVVVLSGEGGIAADGPPGAVLDHHGGALAEQGVWVPGRELVRRRAGTAPGEVLLRTEGLGYRHPGAPGPALSDVTITVRAGEALGVRGPNGAGKSTLAGLLGGLLAPTCGAVRATGALAGPGDDPRPHRWRARDLAGRIGSVFQNPEHQFLASRVDEELAIGPRLAGQPAPAVAATVDELLARMRLGHLAAANPYTLSGGEQRRLAVATALGCAPQVLVLDEPTFGQDLRTWAELVDLLATLRDEGRGIVAVTHDADLVEVLADRVLSLQAPAGAPAPRVGPR
ncbi:MAG: energy-coupling factor ABC transporter ATP-binding protein [Dactylosporangium sp.]|nr:energy-coupling factor ABC transporter ATP-binding protein [Dactylosporangium sp.]